MLVTRLSPVLLIHWSHLCTVCKRLCLAGCINMYVCVTRCWVFVLWASWHQLVQLKHSCWREKFNMRLFWCHLPFHWFLFFFNVWVWWVFPTWRSPLNNCQCLSLTLSLCEDGDMLGGSPAVWQKNVLALVWRLLAFWHMIFAVEGGHSVAGFPCKVGPAWPPHGGRLFLCHISSRLHPRPLGLIPLSFCEGHGINNPQVLYG